LYLLIYITSISPVPTFLTETASWPQAIWAIALLATAGVILRPWRLPEAVWAVLGAGLLVSLGLLPLADALHGIARGTDVYLFLIGMMLLAEVARKEGLFDWLAMLAGRLARGSALRLFTFAYLVGIVVTVFLSNDATAIVLTPAVAAVARTARAEKPLPYLFACAFIANAASFVLPISNPANLVIYGSHMPPLMAWLRAYALPSALAITITYVILYVLYRRTLRQEIAPRIGGQPLSYSGKVAALGILGAALVLTAASAFGFPLGLPTCLTGVASTAIVLLRKRQGPGEIIKDISWGVLLLVAGLFVLVEALDRTGLLRLLAGVMADLTQRSPKLAAWSAGGALAILCNLMNNLPAGLIAGNTIQSVPMPSEVTGAVLIATDLGPNLSVTGSLATLLWLTALRRDGYEVSAWSFLKLGVVAMPPALLLSIGALLTV
jgi:arsenical pump membrane protein